MVLVVAETPAGIGERSPWVRRSRKEASARSFLESETQMSTHKTSVKMSAPEGKGSARKSKHMTVKTSLNNPYALQWCTLEGDDMHFILDTLEEVMKQLSFRKEAFRRKKKPCSGQKEKKEPCTQASKLQEKNEPENDKAHGWTNLHVRAQVAIGINEVTKALEKNELELVLVCKSARPAMLTSHLIPLSVSRAVPAGQVPRLSERLAPVLGLTSLLALGFKRNTDAFGEAVQVITPRMPHLEVPWIHHGAELSPGSQARERTDLPTVELPESIAEEGSPSQKRKRTENSRLPPRIRSLQGLKVKKIVPNPNKRRKLPKTKKRISK
ncbi:hypothetical protein JRQ81_018570 [Phrynocephalus forsythii]|uniref:Ribosomal protein eL8/eL30/eS12/Gadd45 domain-containing protein n=1 Tax=Phrynocephalus forsythii TaxID=171643 RepID=A0A9Q0XNR2_9SAUR|nr:hypothetical protein JRQ81_018570 [Phrynocephalus forsythii]